MRYNDFVQALNKQFDLTNNPGVAYSISEAMLHATAAGTGVFMHEGLEYTVMQVWVDGCINGDCNPATCWTNWEVTYGVDPNRS